MPTSPAFPDEIVTAAQANRGFSKLLQGVREGHAYVVTSHGAPVARLEPIARTDHATPEQIEGRRQLLQRLASQHALHAWVWNRETLYDEMLSEPFESK